MRRAVRAALETRVARLEQQIRAFRELHASELTLILDELASVRAEIAAMPADDDVDAAPPDPSASPKRARWLAEQQRLEEERRAPRSRRELLRGRDPEAGG